jgi:callose synthase
MFRVIEDIFARVDEYIEKDTLIQELNMSALPILNEQFVKLIEFLVSFSDKNWCVYLLGQAIPLLTETVYITDNQ